MSTTWMINGPGQAVFLGNPNVSQFGAGGGGQTSPGSGYVPDEVAKMIVKESGLRKSDTIPKRVIIGYLESMGLSPGLATDVAMVLRNMYGVTPTFDESTLYSRSGSLIEELVGVVNESYPAPFRIDEPEILNEMDVISRFIADEYLESTDEEYDIALEHLAAISPHDFLDIVEFHEWVGPKGFAYLGDLAVNGPEGLAEEVLEGLVSPHAFLAEDVEFHLDALSEISAGTPSSHPRTHSLRNDLNAADKARKEKAGRAKHAAAIPSFKKQMKHAAKDRAGVDPLAKKAAASKEKGFSGMLAIKGGKEDHASRTKLADKKSAAKAVAKTASRDAMKAKGKKALGFLKSVAKAPFKAGAAVAGAAAQGHGYLKGRSQGAADNAKAAASAKAAAPDSSAAPDKAAAPSGDGGKKPGGIFHKVGQAITKFKNKFIKKRPGIASQGGEKSDGVPNKSWDGGTVRPPVGESSVRGGRLLSEMRDILEGAESVYATQDPHDVFATFEAQDLVGQAVIESLAQLDWDEVAQIASISMLPVEESHALITAYQNGGGDFFHAWRGAKSRVDMPSALRQESFALLADLSMDEGVVPALVGYSFRALQVASSDVAMCVEDAYPDLGKTVYGPAGDPKEGPSLAKSYMTPHACGTDSPDKGRELMQTRMFSDPSVRDQERASKLSDVKNMLGAMRAAAGNAGVDPEGMFLNTYRDMHREKVRYS